MRNLLAPVILVLLCLPGSAATRPNIVLILADDLGIGDVNCYGGDRCQIETPHLDALAAGGLRFTDAHVSASVCVPTRVGIMTGRYPWRFAPGRRGGPWGFLGPRFDTGTVTLGTMFRTAGYRSAYIGKWHLGTVMTTVDGKEQGPSNVDYTQPLRTGPPQHGFDYSFILPGSLDMYPYAYVRDNAWQGEVTSQKGWSAFNRIGPAEKDFEDHEVLETFYREAERFIDARRGGHPFFLYLALTAPHTPTSPGSEWQGRSELGTYGDFVMEVDHAVERVRRALEEKGVLDNTLILFSSDHGAAPYAGNVLVATPGQLKDLEKQGHYSSGPHRGYKFSVYEGGLRVPLIASWPGVIKPGGECDAIVGLNDLLATFAAIAGAETARDEAPDSISFKPLLRDPSAKPPRTNLVMQSAMECFVVRDGEWKLCLCPGSGAKGAFGNEPAEEDAWRQAMKAGVPSGAADLVRAPFVQLFDLSTDPHEDRNLASIHPERVAEMVGLLEAQIANGRSNKGPRLKNDRSPVRLHQRLPEFVRNRLR